MINGYYGIPQNNYTQVPHTQPTPEGNTDMTALANQYQALMAMQRPDLAQGILQQANLPGENWNSQLHSILTGRPDAGLSSGGQLAQMAVPWLYGVYKQLQNQNQWANNSALMQGNASQQLGNMQSNFGLKK